jgi:hypothetical protein
VLWGPGSEGDEKNPMQDLFQNYVSDLNKLRDAFHNELTATAEELSKAMGSYAHRSEAALASFMEKVSARGMELEASAAARLNQFRGLPANGGLPNVDGGPLADTPSRRRSSENRSRCRAGGRGRSECRDRWGSQPQLGRLMTLVKSEPAA